MTATIGWRNLQPLALAAFTSLVVSSNTYALDIGTTVGLEGQIFTKGGAQPGQLNSDSSASVELEFRQSFNGGDTLFNFIPFGRWDSRDDERRHADIRELNIIHVIDDVEVLAGISKVFWGVTESAHLVDIINQTDYLEGFDGEDKLGQPMIRVSKSFEQSTLSGFILPGFRERAFLSRDNPLALPFEIDDANPVYDSSDDDQHIDYALRYSGYAGSVDYGLSVFNGTSRDPVYIPGNDDRLLPVYQQITQIGLDLQLTRGAWLWKLEGIRREFDTPLPEQQDYSAAVGGFEYSFYGVADGRFDLGLLMEHHYDSRKDRSTVAFQNELFLGTRLGFTDAESTELLAGALLDLDDNTTSFRVEASRRIDAGDRLGDALLSVDAQVFTSVDPDNLFSNFSQSDFLRITLELYF